MPYYTRETDFRVFFSQYFAPALAIFGLPEGDCFGAASQRHTLARGRLLRRSLAKTAAARENTGFTAEKPQNRIFYLPKGPESS
jgi:hypothetical protein